MTALLKSKGMWDDMVVVFSADNGGPIYGNTGTGGANNYPLKGGKMNNWCAMSLPRRRLPHGAVCPTRLARHRTPRTAPC